MLQLTTIVFLIAFSVLAVIHNLAIQLYLYWHIWWLDIPVHAFGGAIVALGLFTLRDLKMFPNSGLRPLPVIAIVIGVALIWEAYEVAIGLPMLEDYIFDTVLDVCMGLGGGIIGYVIGNSLRKLR
jgi:hypothetical protein